MNTDRCDQVVFKKQKTKKKIELVPSEVLAQKNQEKEDIAVPKKFSRPNKLVDIEAMTNHLEQVSVSSQRPLKVVEQSQKPI